jgi:peptide/nickel transport system substrate-binding protein
MYRNPLRVGGVLATVVGALAIGAQSSSASQWPGAADTAPFTMTTEASGPFPKSFNPFITSTYAGYVNHLIYEPLYQLNYAKLQPIPWLATSYTWSNNGKTMTFGIRPGVQWSNGTPFSAADVAFTFNLNERLHRAITGARRGRTGPLGPLFSHRWTERADKPHRSGQGLRVSPQRI